MSYTTAMAEASCPRTSDMLAWLATVSAAMAVRDAQIQVGSAMMDAAVHMRPMCLFNHPLFPGQRFHLNAGPWRAH